MNDQSQMIALVVLVAILVIAYWAYDCCKLNKHHSAKHKKKKKRSGGGSFVGAMGQHPALVPCAFPTSENWQMNRCNYS